MLTPLKPGRALFLRILFWLAKVLPLPSWTLLRLKRIHFARFAIVSSIPPDPGAEAQENLRSKYLLFDSNFNGTWHDYLEAFSYIFPRGMTALWGGCYGFPGPTPDSALKEYVGRSEYVAAHYYCAYPEATTRMALSGLALSTRLRRFDAETAGLGPAEFERAFHGLLTEVQGHI